MFGQQPQRFQAQFSLQEVWPSGEKSLTRGTVRFDRTVGQIVYETTFPQTTTIVVSDTGVHTYCADSLIGFEPSATPIAASVFSLILSGELSYFGMKGNAAFELDEVQKNDSTVVTTWRPKNSNAYGEIALQQRDKLLTGIVIYSPDGAVVLQQNLEAYRTVKGVQIPMRITTVVHSLNGKHFRILALSKPVVDGTNLNQYRYPALD